MATELKKKNIQKKNIKLVIKNLIAKNFIIKKIISLKETSNKNIYGALLVCATAVISSFNNSFVHSIGTTLPVMQIVFIKSFIAFCILVLTQFNNIGKIAKTKNLKIQFTKGFVAFVGIILYTLSLQKLTIAQTVVFSSTTALFTSAGAAIFFNEYVARTRWFIILIVLFGVILPHYYFIKAINPYIFLPLSAALSFSISSLIIKKLCKSDSTYTILFYLLLFLSIFSAPFAWYEWKSLGLSSGPLAIGAGVCFILYQLLLIEAYSKAQASFIAPFKFIKYPLNILAGILFFSQWPTISTLTGGLIILTSTITLVYLEKKANREESKQKIK